MIQSIIYADKNRIRQINQKELPKLKKKNIWIDIIKPDKNDIEFLKKRFKFHKLALEDCLHAIQRPKIDDYGNYYFIAMHSFYQENKKIKSSELDMFLGKNFIITVHEKNLEFLEDFRSRLNKNPALLLKGADVILYNILDNMVDSFFPVIDEINNSLDKVEDEIFRNPKQQIISKLFHLRRNSLIIRKSVAMQREVVDMLISGDARFIQQGTVLYLRDVYDHLYRIYETTDTIRDTISSALESYLSTISNRMNEIMKTLTIIATIVLPLSLVAGIYGMNFANMPELNWQYGYYAVLLLMLFIGSVMLLYFRKKRWI